MKTQKALFLKILTTIILSLIVFLIFNKVILQLSSLWVKGIGVIMVFIPPLVWHYFYSRLDIEKPEPFNMVFLAFLIGVVVALYILMPIKSLATTYVWNNIFQSTFDNLLFSFLCGFISIFLVLISLRLLISSSEYFDEPIDAIIYSTNTGLGLAFAQNISYVFSLTSMNVGVVFTKVALNSLAYSSISGVLGIGIAKAKFNRASNWVFGLYTAIASIMLSFVFWLENLLNYFSIKNAMSQSFVDLIALGILTSIITFFVIKQEEKIKRMQIIKVPSISTKPSIIIVLVAVFITLLLGFSVKKPNYIKYPLENGININLPSSSIPISSDENSQKFIVIYKQESYDLTIFKLDKMPLENLINRYATGNLYVFPGENAFSIPELKDSLISPTFAYYKVITPNITREPGISIQLDKFIAGKENNWMIRLEGKSTKSSLELLRYLLSTNNL